jgi:hypothetical protein
MQTKETCRPRKEKNFETKIVELHTSTLKFKCEDVGWKRQGREGMIRGEMRGGLTKGKTVIWKCRGTKRCVTLEAIPNCASDSTTPFEKLRGKGRGEKNRRERVWDRGGHMNQKAFLSTGEDAHMLENHQDQKKGGQGGTTMTGVKRRGKTKTLRLFFFWLENHRTHFI